MIIDITPGAIVECVAPSSRLLDDKQEQEVIESTKKFFEFFGWTMRYSHEYLATKGSHLYANTNEYRAESLARAMQAKDSAIIWPVTGGYGASVIIPRLHELLLGKPLRPKWLIGFSDITALHSYFINQFGWPTLHWENLKRIFINMPNPEAVHIFKCLANGKNDSVTYEIQPLNKAALGLSSLESKIFGGNLSVLCYSLGTFWGEVPDNRIIFLEDVNENARVLDLKLHQMLQCGFFDYAQAIIFGEFTCYIGDNPSKEQELIRKLTISGFADSMNLPVFKLQKIGHLPYNRPLPLNTKALISKTNDKHQLSVEIGIR